MKSISETFFTDFRCQMWRTSVFLLRSVYVRMLKVLYLKFLTTSVDIYMIFSILITNSFIPSFDKDIYRSEITLNTAKQTKKYHRFLISICQHLNNNITSKTINKRGDFDSDIINLHFFDGDAPRNTSWCMFISHFSRFAGVCTVLKGLFSVFFFLPLTYVQKGIFTINTQILQNVLC